MSQASSNALTIGLRESAGWSLLAMLTRPLAIEANDAQASLGILNTLRLAETSISTKVNPKEIKKSSLSRG